MQVISSKHYDHHIASTWKCSFLFLPAIAILSFANFAEVSARLSSNGGNEELFRSHNFKKKTEDSVRRRRQQEAPGHNYVAAKVITRIVPKGYKRSDEAYLSTDEIPTADDTAMVRDEDTFVYLAAKEDTAYPSNETVESAEESSWGNWFGFNGIPSKQPSTLPSKSNETAYPSNETAYPSKFPSKDVVSDVESAVESSWGSWLGLNGIPSKQPSTLPSKDVVSDVESAVESWGENLLGLNDIPSKQPSTLPSKDLFSDAESAVESWLNGS